MRNQICSPGGAMKSPATFLSIAAIVVGAVVSGIADEAVEMRLSDNVMMSPASLRVTVLVQRDKENRYLIIEADSPTYYRSSQVPLSGESAPRSHGIEFRSLPEGVYQIRASVEGTEGIRAQARQTAIVTGTAEDLTKLRRERPPRGR